MFRIVREAVLCKRRFARTLGLAILLASQGVNTRAQERVPSLGTDNNARAQAPEDAPIPPAAGSKGGATPRKATWRKLSGNFLQDQKDLWLFPMKLAQGHHWLPAALVVGVTAGLIATDPKTMPHFRQTNGFSGFNSAFSV